MARTKGSGTRDPNRESQICTTCNVEKPIGAFDVNRVGKTMPVYHSSCKECRYQVTYLWMRQHTFRTKYGIELEEYDRRLADQGGVCAICHKGESMLTKSGNVMNLAVDHNHFTGEVRGLLCHICNRTIGLFGEDITVLKNAIAYLEGDSLG